MPKTHRPRRGSMQYWPRKRAKKSYSRVRSWASSNEIKLLGFPGYKAGMTHIQVEDTRQNSRTAGEKLTMPATILECPPIKPMSIRLYKNTTEGQKLIAEIFSTKLAKELRRKTKTGKSGKTPEEFDEIKITVYTQPSLTGIGKKKPEIIEMGIGGDVKGKLEHAKRLLEEEAIRIEEVLEEGQFIDTRGVTKGKGFQGTVKRYGVTIRQHKSEKTKRGIGNLGAWTPKKVQYTVPQPGKMGHHQRTEYNKLILKIGKETKEINPKGGFLHYGNIRNDYIILKGSVQGPAKRLLVLTEPIRNKQEKITFPIRYVSLESKQ